MINKLPKEVVKKARQCVGPISAVSLSCHLVVVGLLKLMFTSKNCAIQLERTSNVASWKTCMDKVLYPVCS